MLPPLGEIGRTGTFIFGGQMYAEYQPKLQGSQKYRIYEEMRCSDASISNALDMLKLPIQQAKWSMEPAREDEELGEEIAQFVKRVLLGDEGSDTWTYILQQALLMLDFGFCPLEKVWELRERPAALKGTKAPDKVLWLKKLAPRMPYTVAEWIYEGGSPENGPLLGIRQRLPLGGMPIIPIEKLVVFTNRKEGDNWEGRSILRSAYKDWFIKDRLEKIDAIGHEHMALGIPVFKIEEGFGIDLQSDEGKVLLERCEEIAANLHANEQNYVIETPGVTFRFEVPRATNRSLLDSIQLHNHSILANILAQFMDLGNTQTGSRAVAKEQHGPFVLGLLSVADNIASTMQRFVVKELVVSNYGERPGYPTVTYSGVADADMTPLAMMLKDLAMAGFVTPDDDLEAWLRETLGLPAKPKEPEEIPEEALELRSFADSYPFSREPTDKEKYVAFEEIHFELESSKARFEGTVTAVARKGIDKLVEEATKAAMKGGATNLRLKMPGLEKAIAREISELVEYGARQVAQEHARARKGTPVRRQRMFQEEDEWEEVEPLTTPAGIKAYGKEKAGAAAVLISGAVLSAVMMEAVRLFRTADDEIAARISLQTVADSALEKAARECANKNVASSFGIGRAMEIDAQVAADYVIGAYYSSLLDISACEACAARDGEYYEVGSPEFERFKDGNSDECAGKDACRCMLFMVHRDEATA